MRPCDSGGRLTVDAVQSAFLLLTSPSTAAKFFDEYVADDVLWTVMGTAYLGGTTRGRSRFVAEDVARLVRFQIPADNEANTYRLVAEFANDYTAARFLDAAHCKDALGRFGRLVVKPLTVSRYEDGEAGLSSAPVPRGS